MIFFQGEVQPAGKGVDQKVCYVIILHADRMEESKKIITRHLFYEYSN